MVFAITLEPSSPRQDNPKVALDGKACAAAARGDGIGVLYLERLSDEIVDKVDFGAAHEFEAHRIDVDGRFAARQHEVIVGRLFLDQIVFILKARASATGHGDTQNGARLFL